MKNIIIKLCLVAILMNVLSGCKKWLEVQPEDRFTEEQIFKTAQGFEDALNGIYISMGKANLYGENLTLSVLDILAQRYNISSSTSSKYGQLITYDYRGDKARPKFDAIWEDSYIAIANANQLLANLDKYSQNITASRAKIMKGEILGLRAFLHFDLLRMYGPIYDSPDSTKLAIPYYKALTPKIGNFESANAVMDKILTDLKDAEALLINDPVKVDGSKNLNSYRFNYYAIKALEARVQLWRNNKVGALNAAKTVIDASALFPWVVGTTITGDNQSPNRLFSTELLFATYNKDLYTSYDNLYYFELAEDNILSAKSAVFIDAIYENNSNDYRNSYMWRVPPLGKDYPTFLKYADAVDKTKPYRFTIPLIRLSELYYIAAETEPDATTALGYLNAVRNHRGVISLTSPSSLSNEILKEYQKEFYGEGQLWFYYKRKKINVVVSPNSATNIGIPSSAWIFPVPDAELANR